MEDPPARKPTQAERRHALRQQARAGDLVAQAQVDALNACARASAAKAKAEGRDYWSPERQALRWATKHAAALAARTPAQVERARQRAWLARICINWSELAGQADSTQHYRGQPAGMHAGVVLCFAVRVSRRLLVGW